MKTTKIERLFETTRFSHRHRRVWFLGAAGILLDGFDFFIMGVALPLIAHQWGLNAWQTGLVTSAAIFGAIVGAAVMGTVSDMIGRRLAFTIDLGMFVVFAALSAFAPDIWWLIAFRFLLGVGIGADYPISAAYVSEIAPSRFRAQLVVGAFSFQAVGQLLGVALGLVLLTLDPSPDVWRWMLAAGVVPALILAVMRIGVPESPKWLAAKGKHEEAAKAMSHFCGRAVGVDEVRDDVELIDEPSAPRLPETRHRQRKALVLTSVPWFLMDIATYGVGVFTPTILAALSLGSSANSGYIADDIVSTQGAAAVDVFLVLGFLLAILLVGRVSFVKMQTFGFVVMAGGLLLLGSTSLLPGGSDAWVPLVFLGFGAFNLFMNMGPNPVTYLMPTAAFPPQSRARGAGIAAASGKAGAAVGTLFFPILLAGAGLFWTLAIVAAGCLIAAIVTWSLRSVVREEVEALQAAALPGPLLTTATAV